MLDIISNIVYKSAIMRKFVKSKQNLEYRLTRFVLLYMYLWLMSWPYHRVQLKNYIIEILLASPESIQEVKLCHRAKHTKRIVLVELQNSYHEENFFLYSH